MSVRAFVSGDCVEMEVPSGAVSGVVCKDEFCFFFARGEVLGFEQGGCEGGSEAISPVGF